MNELINDSLKYPLQSDAFLRLVALGGLLTFTEQVSLRVVLSLLASDLGVAAQSDAVATIQVLDGGSRVLQGGLGALALGSFVVLTGFYVRIAERVTSGEETPPGFSDGTQLLANGALFCGTLLAIAVVVLAVEVAVGLILFGVLVLVEAALGVPSLRTVLFVLWMLIGVAPFTILLIYPQPAIWILIARSRKRGETGPTYVRYVASLTFVAELRSILLSRKYVSSWGALVVVSMLNGAATIQGESLLAATQPVGLLIGLNTRLVSAIVGFYVSVAVVYLFARRFREREQHRQETLFESSSSHDAS